MGVARTKQMMSAAPHPHRSLHEAKRPRCRLGHDDRSTMLPSPCPPIDSMACCVIPRTPNAMGPSRTASSTRAAPLSPPCCHPPRAPSRPRSSSSAGQARHHHDATCSALHGTCTVRRTCSIHLGRAGGTPPCLAPGRRWASGTRPRSCLGIAGTWSPSWSLSCPEYRGSTFARNGSRKCSRLRGRSIVERRWSRQVRGVRAGDLKATQGHLSTRESSVPFESRQ